MGGLLDQAKRFLRGFTPAPPSRPQRFSVACAEGHRLAGLRTEGYQALRCPTCGEGVFVLPRSPLPEPAGPSASASRRARAATTPGPAAAVANDDPVALSDPVPAPEEWASGQGGEAGDEDVIEWVDEGGDGPDGPPARPATALVDPSDLASEEIAEAKARRRARDETPPTARSSSPSRGKPRRPAVDVRAETDEEPAPRLGFGGFVRRHRNPLLFGSVALLVLLAVGIRYRRARLQELPKIAELGRTEGLAALDDGDIDKAKRLLFEADQALDSLGDGVAGALEIRQGAREVEALSRLVPLSLEELLARAVAAAPKDWDEEFRRDYRGGFIIIDTTIARTPDASGGGEYDLDYRVFRPDDPPQTRRVGRIDTTGFKRLREIQPGVGDHVLLAARLASFRYDLERDEWRIGLEPDSGISIKHFKALVRLGWPTETGAPESAEDDRP